MKKKLLSLILVLALVFSNSAFVMAAGEEYLKDEPKVTITKEMSGAEAMKHIGDENSIFLDLRSAEDYAAGHIKGTVSAPVCLPASQSYKVPVSNREAFVAQMKELKVAENNTTIYLHCYAGTFCVNYAADWLMSKCDVEESQLVRVLGGTFGDKDLGAASNFTNLDYALEAAKAGTGIILDVRATDVYYANGYLDGALHQPLFNFVDGANKVTDLKDDLAKNFNAFVEANKELLTSKNVYILCNSGASGAKAATTLLAEAGLTSNVFTIENGAKGLAANHPELMVNQNTKTVEETIAVTGTATVQGDKNANAVVIDVRTVENYNIGHVKGALSYPVFGPSVTSGYDELAKAFLEKVAANAKTFEGKDIYIVCNSGASGAKAATKLLMQAGYSNSKIFTVTGGAKALAAYQTFVSPAQTMSVVGNAEYVILDVRAAEKYAAGHLNKSVSAPLFTLNETGGNVAVQAPYEDAVSMAFKKYLADNKETLATKTIYILCNSGETGARNANVLLAEAGLTKVYSIDGGAKALASELYFVKSDYAFAQVEKEAGIILDLRATELYYEKGYVDGSLHAPLFNRVDGSNVVTDRKDALAQNFKAFVEANKALLTNTNIYLLCNGGASGAAAAHALLAETGIKGNVYTIEGGANALYGTEGIFVNQQFIDGKDAVAVSGTATVPSANTDKVIIIDVRAVERYNVGHLKGALSCPLFTVDENDKNVVTSGYDALAQAFLAKVEENAEKFAGKDIYIVCNSGASGAKAATKLLMQAGYSNSVIYSITGGAKGTAEDMSVPQNSKFVSPAQALNVVDNEAYLILDVRATEKYEAGTLPGAVSVPLFIWDAENNKNVPTTLNDDLATAFRAYVAENKEELASKTIYILCNSGESGARNANKLLAEAGLTNVYSIDGGAAAYKNGELVTTAAPAKVTLSQSIFTYNGVAKKPTVTAVTDTNGEKISKEFYTVSYANNVKAGKGTVKVTFKGRYADFAPMTRTITINKAKASTIKLVASSYVYTGKMITPKFKTAAGVTLAASDYTVVKRNKTTNVGKATITIKFKGNVNTATKAYTFTINPKGTSITGTTAAKKAFTVKWKAQKAQTSGYQVRYSTYKNFTKYTTKSVGTKYTSKKLTGLSSNKTYYVKVRTYKKVNGKTYYSAWSAVKTVKTK